MENQLVGTQNHDSNDSQHFRRSAITHLQTLIHHGTKNFIMVRRNLSGHIDLVERRKQAMNAQINSQSPVLRMIKKINEQKIKKIFNTRDQKISRVDQDNNLINLKAKIQLGINTQNRAKNHRMPTNASINIQSNLLNDMKAMIKEQIDLNTVGPQFLSLSSERLQQSTQFVQQLGKLRKNNDSAYHSGYQSLRPLRSKSVTEPSELYHHTSLTRLGNLISDSQQITQDFQRSEQVMQKLISSLTNLPPTGQSKQSGKEKRQVIKMIKEEKKVPYDYNLMKTLHVNDRAQILYRKKLYCLEKLQTIIQTQAKQK